jgi:hypothetical protein
MRHTSGTEELRDEPFVLFKPGSGLRHAIIQILLADNNNVFAVASERSMEYDFHMAKEASVCRHFSLKAQAMGPSGNIW